MTTTPTEKFGDLPTGRFTFVTPFEQYAERDGQPVTVLRWITEPDDHHDAEVLPMAVVLFDNGEEIEAWPEELPGSQQGANMTPDTATTKFEPGDRVIYSDGRGHHRIATVHFHGRCDHEPCPHGDDCVRLTFDGETLSVNRPASSLELVF